MFKFMLFVLLLAMYQVPRAGAYDHGDDEGQFNNTGNTPLFCYKDIYPNGQWTICASVVSPGHSCRGDAIAAKLGGEVYKIPNRTEFNCTSLTPGSPIVSCSAANRMSAIVITLAKVRHGGGYKAMSWDDFYKLMTGGSTPPIRSCDANWIPLPNGICYE
jgi:hypothetical protein